MYIKSIKYLYNVKKIKIINDLEKLKNELKLMSMFSISVITYPTNRYNPPWSVNLQFKDSYYINNFNV